MTGGPGEPAPREALPHAPERAPLLWQETLAAGEHWSGVLRRGTSLQLVALEAGASVAALLYNHESLLERYNMADTLKAQQPRS